MLALFEVQDFLKRAGRGEIDSSRLEHLIEQFGEDCKESLENNYREMKATEYVCQVLVARCVNRNLNNRATSRTWDKTTSCVS